MAFLRVNFFSNVLGMDTTMNVILPQKEVNNSSITEEKCNEKYPVLYLLHGMGNDESAWMRKTSIERYATEYRFAVIMPTTGLGWYTDTEYGLKYMTFISEELPKVCKEFFANISDKKEDTFVAGLSMGGYGAFKVALTKPEEFKAAVSLSGALDMANNKDMLQSEGDKRFWSGIFGSLEKMNNPKDDLFYLCDAMVSNTNIKVEDRPKFYLWCGTEDFLYKNNLSMEKKMKDLGISIEASYSKGDHNWVYWDLEIQKALKWFYNLRNNA